ncbi:MAG: SDR family oxidoreductase [Phycisphaerales bacterium]|nr:SDR family oxidoreductase [Phycisphaerales bacterium]
MSHDARVALVTGGARRVGRAIALELARAGCDIALHYSTSAEDARQTALDIRSLGRRCETFQMDLLGGFEPRALIQQAAVKLGGLDILVNNAAVFETDGSTDADSPKTGDWNSATWERIFRVNAIAPAGLCWAAAEAMHARGRGKIINLCDICTERPWTNYLAYGASKAALACLTRGLARSLAPRIQVNGVAPGIAEFPEEFEQNRREALTKRVPMQRAGSPEDIARTVRFLVEGPDYITGQIIAVDGGRSIAW